MLDAAFRFFDEVAIVIPYCGQAAKLVFQFTGASSRMVGSSCMLKILSPFASNKNFRSQ